MFKKIKKFQNEIERQQVEAAVQRTEDPGQGAPRPQEAQGRQRRQGRTQGGGNQEKGEAIKIVTNLTPLTFVENDA